MKKVFVIIIAAVAGISLVGFRSQVVQPEKTNAEAAVEIPENVNSVIQNSCFGCHNSESRNEDAKGKLQFDKLDSLPSFKLIGKLDDMKKEISEGEMPPTKFLERFPDHALSSDDKTILLDWVNETSGKLKGE